MKVRRVGRKVMMGILAGMAVALTADAAGWWDGGYGYRQQITVTASTDALSAGYSVAFTFDHAVRLWAPTLFQDTAIGPAASVGP